MPTALLEIPPELARTHEHPLVTPEKAPAWLVSGDSTAGLVEAHRVDVWFVMSLVVPLFSVASAWKAILLPAATEVLVAPGQGVGVAVGFGLTTGVGVGVGGGPGQMVIERIEGPGGLCVGPLLLLPPQLNSNSEKRITNAGSRRNQIRRTFMRMFRYDGGD
jgi:hypothetical protein